MRRGWWTLAAAWLLACGGGGDDAARGDIAAAPVAGQAPPVATTPGDTSCPMVGAWRPCAVQERLESAGLVPDPIPDSARQPAMGIAGSAWRVGSAELQAFFFADSAAAAAAAARFTPGEAGRPLTEVTYTLPPVAIASGNMVAILYARTERQIERVQLALTAGLPSAAP